MLLKCSWSGNPTTYDTWALDQDGCNLDAAQPHSIHGGWRLPVSVPCRGVSRRRWLHGVGSEVAVAQGLEPLRPRRTLDVHSTRLGTNVDDCRWRMAVGRMQISCSPGVDDRAGILALAGQAVACEV